jgi:hypothetical protein
MGGRGVSSNGLSLRSTALLGSLGGASGAVLVAVGDAGTIRRSEDGITWTTSTAPSTDQLVSVCYSPDLTLWVAGGATGRIITSPDGVTWTSRRTSTGQIIQGLAWSPTLSLFAAVGTTSAAASVILTSPTGTTWTARTAPHNQQYYDVDWSPTLGTFAAGTNFASTGNGNLAVSTNGTTWTDQALAGTFSRTSVRWAGASQDRWVVADFDGGVTNSNNTTTWSTRAVVDATTTQWWGGAWSPTLGLYALSGLNGTAARLYTSPDLSTWTSRTVPSSAQLYKAAWSSGLGLFVVTGQSGRIYTSSNGTTWTQQTSGTTNTMRAVAST